MIVLFPVQVFFAVSSEFLKHENCASSPGGREEARRPTNSGEIMEER